jgi:hypothetical protein
MKMDNRYSPATILAAMLVLGLPPCAAAQTSTRISAQPSATTAATTASVSQAASAVGSARTPAEPATVPPDQSSTPSQSCTPAQSSSAVTARPSEESIPAKAAHNNAEAIGLLQRVHELLGHYHSDDGKNLKLAGKVTMERADVDEMAAVVQELELMLQK